MSYEEIGIDDRKAAHDQPIPIGVVDFSSPSDLRRHIEVIHGLLLRQAEMILGQSERIDELTGQDEPEKREKRAL